MIGRKELDSLLQMFETGSDIRGMEGGIRGEV